MCGIGGEVYFSHSDRKELGLNRMAESMRERGPDDEGMYHDEFVGLVHRRLSIIDLSPAGHCPLNNEDGTVKIVFNGEIYNYQELRKCLLNSGHRFRSRSDTEVVVHGYEQWGEDVVSLLNGMFAFAIWDANKRTLFMARDRLGEKPLYYARIAKKVAFASTLIAVTAAMREHFSINLRALNAFLTYGYIPGPETIWNEVRSLLPGHTLTITHTGNITLRQYWDFPSSPTVRMPVGEAERYIESLLADSVKYRMIADVPVGGFLSGGVDSSLIMALAAKHSSGINTFSIGFEESDFNELKYAGQVARIIGSNHSELVLSAKDVLSVIPMLIWHYGQPYGDSSCIPTHLVSKLSRHTVKVSLTGDGGDESFAGYPRPASNWYASLYQQMIPEHIRRYRVPNLCEALGSTSLSVFFRRLKNLNALSLSKTPPCINTISWQNYLNEIQGPAIKDRGTVLPGQFAWNRGKDSVVRQVLYDDFKVQLPDDFLVKLDIASMAASLEVRSPFLDHRLIEAAWTLPDDMKLRLGQGKWLLKRIAARYFPKSIIYRKKMGFALPMRPWWQGELARALSVLMADSRAVQWGWIHLSPVVKALSEHRSGAQDHATRLWLILCLELWARIVVEQSMPRSCSLMEITG